MCHRLSPIRLRATISVWNGVSFSIGGSHVTGFSSPNDSTCKGLSAVKSRSDTSGWESNMVVRM